MKPPLVTLRSGLIIPSFHEILDLKLKIRKIKQNGISIKPI